MITLGIKISIVLHIDGPRHSFLGDFDYLIMSRDTQLVSIYPKRVFFKNHKNDFLKSLKVEI